jgi:hypothetical protein
MDTWVIPYSDQPLSFWEELNHRYGEQICEVYFPMPGDEFASGRPKLPEKYILDFLAFAPVPKAVLINPIVLAQPIEEIGPNLIDALADLQNRYQVTNVTVTSATLARLIRKNLPDFKITVSVLMGISMPAQILTIRDYVDAIVPDTRTHRNLPLLKSLRRIYQGELRLLVNESCLPGCLFRTQHFYEMAYSNSPMPRSLCEETLHDFPWLGLTSGWILPQHIKYYDGLYDSLKLSGRVSFKNPVTYMNTLDAYINHRPLQPTEIGGGPASSMPPMDIPDAVFENLLNCNKDCMHCSYCQDQYQQLTDSLIKG